MVAFGDYDGTIIYSMSCAIYCIREFKKDITVVSMGVGYGGEVERISNILNNRGVVHGFDTFNGHPKHLAEPGSKEQNCMEEWYDMFGREKLEYEYQRKRMGNNVVLHKGEINNNSLDGIDKIHLALLDMDIAQSMELGFNLVKDKIVQYGYLFLHDVIPENHLSTLTGFYKTVKEDKRFVLLLENPLTFTAVFMKV
jgi:hypothetical protein